MIARIRGEHDTRWGRWRPGAARDGAATPAPGVPPSQRDAKASLWRRALWVCLAAGAAIAVGSVAETGWLSAGPAHGAAAVDAPGLA